MNYNSRQCLALAAGKTNPGTSIIQWNCDGTPSQNWAGNMQSGATTTLQGPAYAYVSNGQIYINLMCVGIAAGSASAGANVIYWNCLSGDTDQE